MSPPRTFLVLYLMGFISGGLQVGVIGPGALLVTFDMANTSFDDQYLGCVDQMEEKLGVLHQTEDYLNTWEEAAAKWNETKASVSVPEGFEAEYAIAALAYTQKDYFWPRYFNRAVKIGGESEDYYLKNFRDKAFHFFLTRALQVLRANSSAQCHDTYSHLKNLHFIAKYGQKVRFGYFASASLNRTEATVSWEDTFFTIRTCYGASIKEFSFHPEEEEVVIPPFEVFHVENSIETPDGIYITLVSAGMLSKYNCVYAKGNHKGT
ncbi:UNVERIFIED_CONTAM: hypothetical protein K2H54_073390 [Gekko kuhli]